MGNKKKKTILVMSAVPGENNTVAFQAALHEVIENGGEIYLREGIYGPDGQPILGPRDWSPRTGKCDCKKHQGPVAE